MTGAPLRSFVAEPPPSEVRRVLERLRQRPNVAEVVVLPDVHIAGESCVGTVVATHDAVFPDLVGGDIGCGMAAIPLDPAHHDVSESEASALFAELRQRVPPLRHSKATRPPQLPPTLAGAPLSDASLEKRKEKDGVAQWGTLGRGNHFLELQRDERGQLWWCVHTGSRGMGQAIRALHGRIAEAGGTSFWSAGSREGSAYLRDAAWAFEYARANRARILCEALEAIRRVLGAAPADDPWLECDHNHVRVERHAGRSLCVHRKGALGLDEGADGIIPGSMGAATFHVVGRGAPESLRSCSHGAGRSMTRRVARQEVGARSLRAQMRQVHYEQRLEARLCEEAPTAYREIGQVMRAQRSLVRITRRLDPVLVYKGV